MTVNTVYVAFPASQALDCQTRSFTEAALAAPKQSHQGLLDQIPDAFIDEVLKAFFQGPVDAAGMTGGTASVVHGLMSIVGRASRALAGKVLSKVTLDEQAMLAKHFQALMLEKDGAPYCGFPIDGELANEAVLMFQSFRDGTGDQKQMIRIMTALGDGAIKNFFDAPLANIKVGFVTRGLVSAGRATIEKASHSMNAKFLPDLEANVQLRVLEHMESMVQEF